MFHFSTFRSAAHLVCFCELVQWIFRFLLFTQPNLLKWLLPVHILQFTVLINQVTFVCGMILHSVLFYWSVSLSDSSVLITAALDQIWISGSFSNLALFLFFKIALTICIATGILGTIFQQSVKKPARILIVIASYVQIVGRKIEINIVFILNYKHNISLCIFRYLISFLLVYLFI